MTGKKKSTKPEALGIQELETLELLDKPSLVPIKNESFSEIDVHSENVCIEEDVLAPFLKFFKGSSDSVVEEEEVGGVLEGSKERGDESEEAKKTSWLISWDCSRGRCFCGFRTSGLEKNQPYLNWNIQLTNGDDLRALVGCAINKKVYKGPVKQ
ncbi:hypothetical protein JHK85_000540 [Glycine max]|nr:hypothetical protein JHK85_000540 [Glycine max]